MQERREALKLFREACGDSEEAESFCEDVFYIFMKIIS